MKEVELISVEPGTFFSFTKDGPVCCVRLAMYVDDMIMKKFNGHNNFLWHCYTPTGTIGWTREHNTKVWIKEQS